MRAREFVSEEWSAKYKRSIDCSSPKGFSQRAHCAGRKKNEGLNEFAPGGNSASSYYAVTANFVNEFAQQKQEEIQDLIDAGWTKQDLAQSGTQEGAATDIAHFEQVRDGFLKGLKPGFDAYLQGDTQLKDQLGAYWIDNDLPLNQDWEKIYGEPWGDDGEFDEGVAEGSLNEFAPTNGNGKDYLRVLASAWLNDTFNTGDLHKGIKSQEDVERILERGVICADGKKRSYAIGYNHTFDGVVLASDDYYEYDDGGVDSRTNKPWGPYEYIEYSSDQLDEQQLDELSFLGSQCTKDCSGHRAGYEWSQRKGGTDAASWSPSFNKGAWLHNNGF